MNIFMTGASGFVGGEVAARLVTQGHTLTALVRRSPVIRGNDGMLVEGVDLVQGDISEPQFGLDPATFARVADAIDLVIHCAATVRFDLSEAEYAATNVGGAKAAVALAKAAGVPLLHVSTAYVCGTRNGLITEDDPLPSGGWANGYESSKAAAERFVAESGVPHVIARPSIVVGDSVTGKVREFGAVYGLFKIIAEGRFTRIPAYPNASLNFVPIDHVAAGIVELANRMDEAHGAYHLVSGHAIPLSAAVELAGNFNKLHTAKVVDPATFDAAALTSRERWIFENAFGHYSSYVIRDPQFDDRRFRAFSKQSPPPSDIEYFRRLIQHSIDAGFVKAA